MFIESIILHNYRAYRGHNKTSFKPDTKNIFLVAGNNGFGKTYLQPIITQYFIDNKSEIWLLFLIAHSKR